MPCTTPRKSIGRDAAIALGATEWWKGKTPREIATFCLHTVELCCPFEVFHKAVEEALGRSVWTHEFGLNYDGIVAELMGEKPAPTFEEIMNLIPADKRVVLVATDEKGT